MAHTARIVKKPEVRRLEIITAAKELFMNKGYETTTMQDVMKTLEIAKGTIYHYFKSKEELLEAVVQEIAHRYVAEIQIVLAKTKGKAMHRMQVLFDASRVADQQRELLEQLHRPGNIGLHTRLLAVTILKLSPLFAKVIEQGCNEGIFEVEHPLESAEYLLAGIQFLTDNGCYPWESADLIRREKSIPSLFETQLKAAKGTFDFLMKRVKS